MPGGGAEEEVAAGAGVARTSRHRDRLLEAQARVDQRVWRSVTAPAPRSTARHVYRGEGEGVPVDT